MTALTTAGVPRLLFYALGGFVFGFWEGLLWSLCSSLAGSFIASAIAHTLGARKLSEREGRLLKLLSGLMMLGLGVLLLLAPERLNDLSLALGLLLAAAALTGLAARLTRN